MADVTELLVYISVELFNCLIINTVFQIMAHNYKDLLLSLTVKNQDGATFHDVSSVEFDFKVGGWSPHIDCGHRLLLYRVTHLVANLGWVDFDLGCSTILLGQ